MQQKHYIEELQFLPKRDVIKNDEVSECEFKSLRSTLGQLSWVCNQTRPDIAFQVCQLSVNLKNATVEDIIAANKCCKILKNEDVELLFPSLGNVGDAKMVTYSDASFANLKDVGSQEGLYSVFSRWQWMVCTFGLAIS